MIRVLCFVLAMVLLAGGILGFLASSVMLASVDEVPDVQPRATSPDGPTFDIRLSPDDPIVQRRNEQAQTVLFGSLFGVFVGLVILVVAFRIPRRRKTGDSATEDSDE